MKKSNGLFLLVFFAIPYLPVFAQEHKIAFKSGTLVLNEMSNLSLEGYNGNEVVITVTGKPSVPEKAKGLSPVNSQGIQENTGLGIAVNKAGNDTYQIHQILSDGKYTIRIPNAIKVKVLNEGNGDSEIKIKNLNNDLEISTRNADINLENVSGPVLVNTIRGNVVGKFNQNVITPISIISMNGEVDISLPAAVKADLKLSSTHGNIYTDLPIEYSKSEEKSESAVGFSTGGTSSGGSTSISPTAAGPAVVAGSASMPSKTESPNTVGYTIYTPKTSGSKIDAPSVSVNGSAQYSVYVSGIGSVNKSATAVKGKVNGGGGEIRLESRNNNIYLRKF